MLRSTGGCNGRCIAFVDITQTPRISFVRWARADQVTEPSASLPAQRSIVDGTRRRVQPLLRRSSWPDRAPAPWGSPHSFACHT